MNEFWTSTLCTLVGIFVTFIFSYLAFRQKDKNSTKHEGESKGVMLSDIGYIKAGVDDLKKESRETANKLSGLSERVTRCEESCKQAHHRIDHIEGVEHKGDRL